MKTNLKINLMTMVIVVLFAACTNCARPVENIENAKTLSQAPKPPEMDIHTAAFMGNTKAIKQHIVAGTNLDQKDQYGSTPLNIATTFGKTDVALALIVGGADLNLKNNDGSTPLHIAAFFCRTEIASALIENGADKNLKNNFGSTPLESISGPFEQVKPIYHQISTDLGPLGLKLDFDHIEKTRPIIAKILQQ